MEYIPCVIKGLLYLYPTYFKKFMLIPQGLKCSVLLFILLLSYNSRC